MANTGTTQRPVSDPALDVAPSEPDHLVCCRDFLDSGPYISACGRHCPPEEVIPFSDYVCADCAREIVRRLEAMGLTEIEHDLRTCFKSGEPCPKGDEADMVWRRVLREG